MTHTRRSFLHLLAGAAATTAAGLVLPELIAEPEALEPRRKLWQVGRGAPVGNFVRTEGHWKLDANSGRVLRDVETAHLRVGSRDFSFPISEQKTASEFAAMINRELSFHVPDASVFAHVDREERIYFDARLHIPTPMRIAHIVAIDPDA